MPYIEKEIRKKLNPTINSLSKKINTIGSLNYCITTLCLKFLNRSTLSYTILNEIVGVLESAKLEFYRRKVGVYENTKVMENGDIYNT